jgi:tetratricopeptide (TPR) repeat protein
MREHGERRKADQMTGGQPTVRDDTVIQIFTAVNQGLKQGAFTEAVDGLEKILEIDVDYPGASSALKCAEFWKERVDREPAPRDGFERGELLLAHWRVFQAFTERLADVPEMFLFAIKQFIFSSALACYLSAATDSDSGDGDPDVLLQIGRCWKGMGNYERAIENLERANDGKKEDARILAELADCYSLVNESRAGKVFFRESFFIEDRKSVV